MKFDLKIKISTEGLTKNYNKLDEINLFDNHYDNYHFYLDANDFVRKNELCNDIKRLHMSMVYLYLKIFQIMNYMLYNTFCENILDVLKKTKIKVSDCQTVFHFKMNIELESYKVKELVKRAIIAMCLDNSFVPSELREFLLYNITFELSECEEETNGHEEEVNISQKKDNIDDQTEEENDVDNQTANLELSQIDIDQVAMRASLIIEAPNSKIKKILDWLIFCTKRGHDFQDEYATVDVVLNEDIHKKEKTITVFFSFKSDNLSLLKKDEFAVALREMQRNSAISLLNITQTDKRLKKYGVKIAGGTRMKAQENE